METSDEESASIDKQESCWSLHGNKEICSRYEILEIVGSGTFSDIYRARRRSDGVIVALKEVHDIKSAASEIGALQRLNGLPNIVHLIEYFWRENEDAVLVLEYLPSDLYSVIQSAKERNTRLSESEVKAWMLQIVQGLASCHYRNVLHRDLKPSNLLISDSGILKIADFGQARILEDILDVPKQVHIFSAQESKQVNLQEEKAIEHNDQSVPTEGQLKKFGNAILVQRDESSDDMNASGTIEHTSLNRDGSGSQDILGSRGDKSYGEFTSTVGTRWYRAPELLFGATSYGKEIDIWSLGCIFGELLTLEVMFCGSGDVDQLLKIVKVLGGPNEDNWPGSSALPTYGMMQFPGLSNPDGLRSIVPNCSESAFSLLESLVCYSRASNQDMAQLKQSSYFSEDPTPVPLNELDVPPRVITKGSFLDDWHKFNELDGDSEAEDLGDFNITYTPKGYTIKFS